MKFSQLVIEEVKNLVSDGVIPPEHKNLAMVLLERELRRRTNSIVTDIARKVGSSYLLRVLGAG